jgi:hypothetical protein
VGISVAVAQDIFDRVFARILSGDLCNAMVFDFHVKVLRRVIRSHAVGGQQVHMFVKMMLEGGIPHWPAALTPTYNSQMTKFVIDYLTRYPLNVMYVLCTYRTWSRYCFPNPQHFRLVLPLAIAALHCNIRDDIMQDIFAVALEFVKQCRVGPIPDCLSVIAALNCMLSCWERRSDVIWQQRGLIDNAVMATYKWIDACDVRLQENFDMQILLEVIPTIVLFLFAVIKTKYQARIDRDHFERLLDFLPFPPQVAIQEEILHLMAAFMDVGQTWLKIRVGAVFAHILALGDENLKELRLSVTIKKRMKFLLELQGQMLKAIQEKESEMTGQEAAIAVSAFVPCRFRYQHKQFFHRFYDKLPIDRNKFGHLGYHFCRKFLSAKPLPVKLLVRRTQRLHRTLDDPGGYVSVKRPPGLLDKHSVARTLALAVGLFALLWLTAGVGFSMK